jgi:hypothetical protein
MSSAGVDPWPAELGDVSEIPQGIVLKRHRDVQTAGFNRAVRYALLGLVGALLLLGLLNVFGQRPSTSRASTARATLELFAPSRVRGGLLYEARLSIRAHAELENALLRFSPGWLEGQTMNTVEPSPLGQASRDGDLLFTLGHVPAGHVYRLFLQFQVNPTNVGRRRADVALYDGGARLLTVRHTITVFP